ncbi:hypothetical protein [Aminivibrio sp.]|uniref:hypothetical protein n=1 Tax=Aminivibrio sp. TaxID=1872489 RepID=UPI00345EDD27
MAEPLADIVIHKMEQAAELYHRLVILWLLLVRVRPLFCRTSINALRSSLY